MDKSTSVRIKGVFAIIIGIAFCIFMHLVVKDLELGRLYWYIFLFGPAGFILGVYQVVTGKMFKKD